MADPGVILTINGSLAVNGAANNLVNFTTNVSGNVWGGIAFNPGSHGNLNLAKINNATVGISGTNATMIITNVAFKDMSYDAISLTYEHITSSVTITGCSFQDIGFLGIHAVSIYIDSTNSLAYNNVTTVPVTVNNNRFDLISDEVAIYIYQDAVAQDNATSTINGNVAVTGNWINSTDYTHTDGMWVMSEVVASDNATATVTSNFDLNNNMIGSLDYAIYAERGVYVYDNATASTSGFVNMVGNKVDYSQSASLYLYTYAYAYEFGIASISGDFTVRSNTVNDTNSYAIYQESEAYIYDNATGTVSIKSTIDSNKVVDSNSYSIYVYREYETYDAYDASFVGSGDINVTGNIVNNSDDDAIYLELDVYSHGLKTMSLTSSYTVTGNTVVYADDEAMYVDEDIYVYDNSTFTYVSPVTMSNNVIQEASYGPDIYRGIYAYDNATVNCTGDFTVTSNHMVDMYYSGVYVERYYKSYDENSTVIANGAVTITNNEVGSATYDESIYEELEAYSYGYSDVKVTGDLTITGNKVNNTEDDIGIEVERDNLESHDNSSLAVVEAMNITNNVIGYSYEESIYVYIEVNSYDKSIANVTEPVMISGNLIKNNDDTAISFERYMESHEKSNLNIVGDLVIKKNIGPNTYDSGVYVETYAESHENSTMVVTGTVQVLSNNFNCIDDAGIYVERYVESYDNSNVNWTGTLSVLRNNIINLDQEGIYIEYEGAWAYDNSTAVLTGGAVISNNTISVNVDDGIYLYEVGGQAGTGQLNGVAVAKYNGNFLIADNQITLVNTDASGIDVYAYLNASIYAPTVFPVVYNPDYGSMWANASMGNIWVIHNTVNTNGDDAQGIYLETEFEAWGYSGGSVSAVAGSIVVSQNDIVMKGDGVHGIYWDAIASYASGENGNATLITGAISFNSNVMTINGQGDTGIYADLYTRNMYAYVYGDYSTSINEYFGWTATLNVGGYNFNDNTISIVGSNAFGIDIEGSSEAPIQAFAEYGNSVATYMGNMTVSGNTVSVGLDSAGIQVGPIGLYTYYYQGSATLISITNVNGNTVKMNGVDGTGIYIWINVENDASSFDGVLKVDTTATVANNIVTFGGSGIIVHGSSMVFVTGNNMQHTSYVGLSVERSNVIAEDNIITNNVGNGAVFSDNTDSTNIVIGNNTISDNTGIGLNITDSANVRMYNGIFSDNNGYGILVRAGSDVVWLIDAESQVSNNDVFFNGTIEVVSGGVLTLDNISDFTFGAAYNGITSMTVDQGASLSMTNVNIYSYDGKGMFLVNGKLDMISSTVDSWKELYLGPGSMATITGCRFSGNDHNGIRIDGCSPIISGCTIFSNSNGIFIENGAAPSIKSCVIVGNERGIFASNATLDNVVDNIFALNTLAGIYAENVVGNIHANIFLLDKNEIFVLNSHVSVEDNEIGYANMINQVAQYSTALALILSYVDTSSSGLTLSSSGIANDLSGLLSSDLMTEFAPLLLDHVGLYAVNSNVTAEDNTYGLLTYAVYTQNSTLSFSDTVKSNAIVLQWLNYNLDTKNITIPAFVYNGLYMVNSKLTMNGAYIQCMNDAVFLDNTHAVITNSALNASRFDIYSMHGSNVSLSSTTLDGKLKVEDSGSISSMSVFTIIVKDGNGNLVSGAPVTVVDANGKLIAKGNTSNNGQFLANVMGWTQTANGMSVPANYWVNATVGGKTVSQLSNGTQTQTITAQGEKGWLDQNWLPVLLILALIVVIVVVLVVMRMRKK